MPRTLALAWLKASAYFTLGFGAIGVAAATPALDLPWRLFVDLASWPVDGNPGSFDPVHRLFNAISGGLTIGFASLLLWMINGPIAEGAPGARSAVVVALLSWCATDSLGSVLAGAPFNVALNLVFLALFLIPLALAKPSTPA